MPAQFPGNAINKAAEPDGAGGYRSALAEAIQNALFSENFDDQSDYTIETAGSGGNTKDTATIPDGWDGVYNGTSWSPESGDPDNHGSFEISALNARGGTGKAITHYRESSTQRVFAPEDGTVVLTSSASHIRLWMSTSKEYSTVKAATVTVDGTDYTFTATTGAEGATFDDSTPSISDGDTVGSVDTSFNSVTNQRPHRGIVSNAISVSGGETVSVTGADIQIYDTAFGEWRARLNQFTSDSQLIKAPIDPNNPEGTEELYVEFWLKFDQEWYQRDPVNEEDPVYPGGRWASKFFRCASVALDGNIFSGGSSGDLGPMLYWDYIAGNFGVVNGFAFRGGPHGENYKGTDVEALSQGDLNYTNDMTGQEVGGTDPQLPNLKQGGLLVNYTGRVHHEALFGTAEKWTKMAFYVKMNSTQGATDGVFSMYIDDHRIKHIDTIPWIEANGSKMVKWNHFSVGGNDNFHPYPNADKYEDNYTIDDIIVKDYLPETLI